jgi:hypothetical protein
LYRYNALKTKNIKIMKKTTFISLASLFIFIFAISFNSPASVKNVVTEDIVIVDDSTAKANAKCDHSGPKTKCAPKKDCSTKCADKSTKCCSKSKAKKGCCDPKKK